MKRILRRPEVEDYTGLSRSSIYRLMKEGRFPKPIKISEHAAVGWLESELAERQARLVATRDAGAKDA